CYGSRAGRLRQGGGQHPGHTVGAELGQQPTVRSGVHQRGHLTQLAGDGEHLQGRRPQRGGRIRAEGHEHAGHEFSFASRSWAIRYSASLAPPVPSSKTTSGSGSGRRLAERTTVREVSSSVLRPRSAAERVRTGLDFAARISFIRANRGLLVTSVTDTTAGVAARQVSLTPSTPRWAVITPSSQLTERATLSCGQPSSAASREPITEPRPS